MLFRVYWRWRESNSRPAGQGINVYRFSPFLMFGGEKVKGLTAHRYIQKSFPRYYSDLTSGKFWFITSNTGLQNGIPGTRSSLLLSC